MAFLRTEGEANNKGFVSDFLYINNETSWESGKDSDEYWEKRYEYEKNIIVALCLKNKIKSILELGSGPGQLSQTIQKRYTVQNYDLIDLTPAASIFISRGYKGNFISKNLENDFDTRNLEGNYDLIIINDFLEHIRNPSMIISKSKDLLSENGLLFVSIPNWRMGHLFIYRGLFDYDNFVYFMKFHGFEMLDVKGSPLLTPLSKKLDSEQLLPIELVNSWNWYFTFIKVEK